MFGLGAALLPGGFELFFIVLGALDGHFVGIEHEGAAAGFKLVDEIHLAVVIGGAGFHGGEHFWIIAVEHAGGGVVLFHFAAESAHVGWQDDEALDAGGDGWFEDESFVDAAVDVRLAVDVGGRHDDGQRAGSAADAAEVAVAGDVGFVPVADLAGFGVERGEGDLDVAVAEGLPAVLGEVVVEEGFFVDVVGIEIAVAAQKMAGADEVWIVGDVDEAAMQARHIAQEIADGDGGSGADAGDIRKNDAALDEHAGHAAGDGCAHAAAFADERRVVDEMLHGWMLLCREVVSIIAQTRASVAERAILFVDLRRAIT